MHIVLGATGHVGSSVLKHLIDNDEEVLAVTHSNKHKKNLESLGAQVAVVDILDTELLTQTFLRGKSAFILNPPGDISKDSANLELETGKAIIRAIKNSNLRKLVVQSTQGAQKGKNMGDLGTLFEFEEGIRGLQIPTSITRGGFYMSNWDMQLEGAKQGLIQSIFPADFKMPMVDPSDLGKYNAQKMMKNDFRSFEITNLSGPDDYSAQNVADAFSRALGVNVKVEVIPESQWIDYYMKGGFSESSAYSYAHMSKVAFEQNFEMTGRLERGETSIDQYINWLVFSQGNEQRSEHGTSSSSFEA